LKDTIDNENEREKDKKYQAEVIESIRDEK
jgi:hypothetical protein